MARGAGGLRAVFGGRARQQEEARLLAEPVRVLTPVFVAELDRVADAVPWVALFLDTYERTAPLLDRWVADLLIRGRYGELPANLVLTLAGQRRLDPAHWGDRGRLVADVPLGPFTEAEARRLLTGRGVVEEPVVREVLRLSGGLPVLVSTLAANPGAAGEANATAVERFLAGEGDPDRRAAALACALPRRFDEDLVAVAVPSSLPGLYDWLHELPFVVEPHSGRSATTASYGPRCSGSSAPAPRSGGGRRTTGWPTPSLSGGTRRPPVSTGHASGPRSRGAGRPWTCSTTGSAPAPAPRCPTPCAPGSRCAANSRPPPATGPGPWWRRARTPTAPYSATGPRTSSPPATDHRPRPTAVLGLLLTRAELTDTDRVAALVARAWDRYRAREFEAALSDHGRAIAVDPRSERAHQGRAVVLRSLGRHEEALADLDRAEEIAPAWAWAVYERGETYRRMGRLEEALTVLDRAHALDPSAAVPLGSRGLVRHRLGRHEEALDDSTGRSRCGRSTPGPWSAGPGSAPPWATPWAPSPTWTGPMS
ncbi:Tetratricopeptide repeat protein OS=Streptomyces microflavus OX=1919 GN=HUT09_14090 PE=4 SV=1 [Streptomyces microflavus]